MLGSYQSDSLKSHSHNTPTVGLKIDGRKFQAAFEQTDYIDYSPATPTSNSGGSETRGENVALAPRIVAY